MKNRRAILFFLVWSLVFALAIMALSFGRHPVAEVPRATLSDFNADKVNHLEINRIMPDDGKPERILLSCVDGRWRIDAPIAAEADEATIKRIIDSVIFAEPIDELSVSDMASLGRTLRDFGLATPRFTVILSDGGRRESYDFGRLTPSGEEIYARQEGKDGVFTVTARVAHELGRTPNALRRRRLLSFDRTEVVALGLKNAGEPLSKLVKAEGGWRLTEPMEAPADKKVVEELVDALCSAHVIDYAASGAGEELGLGDSEGYALSVRDSFGTVEKIVLGAPDGTNAVWAMTPEGATVKVDAALLGFCRKRQKLLEDTRVFPVEMKSVLSFSVSEGFPAYMLSRPSAAEPWRLASPVDAPADGAVAEGLLARILSLRGVDLSPERSKGLISFTVGTGETNFPSRSVSSSFLPDGMRLADLRDKLLIRCARANVKRIRVDTATGVGWDATRSEALLGGLEKGIVAESVETVVFRVGDFERCGFSRPSYTLTFELNDKTSALRKLLLGTAAPGGGRFAMLGGSDAAFILSAATVSMLTKPVEETLEKKK